MRLAVLALVGGLALAAALGGRLRNLPAERLRWPSLALVAVALYSTPLLLNVARQGAVAMTLCSYVALLAFAGSNLRLVGMAVVAFGLSLNAVVILTNGGMPVDPGAVVAAGVARPEGLASLDLGNVRQWQDGDDRLAALGDVVPVAPLDEVVSFGDLILAAGLANVSFRLLRPVDGSRRDPSGRRGRSRRPRLLLARLTPAR